MIKSPVKFSALCAAALLLALPVCAQAPSAAPPADDSRDASFLPPPSFNTPEQPVAQPPVQPSVAMPVPTTTPATPVPIVPSPVINAPAPLVATPVPTTVAPSASPAVAAQQAIPETPVAPVDLGKPVQATKLNDINPQSIGVLGNNDGGLGAGMWKGTPRELVEGLLPTLNLPSSSLTLNNLAQRFLLTTADVPAGKAGSGPSLTTLRVNNLVQLGDMASAWKLISLAPPEDIDDDTYKHVAEILMNYDDRKDVCAKLPDIVKARPKGDWQQIMLVCQLQAKDLKAAQLTLDLMHSQGMKDDTFFYLAERNVIGGAKELPRQLTPLKPLTLALLQLTDLPVRSELYAHPDAALIPPLLAMKTHDDSIRLALAERAGERGIISATQLEGIYASSTFPTDAVANAINSNESMIPRMHALLYQASTTEKDIEKRIKLATKFLQSSPAGELNGTEAQVMGDIIGPAAPTEGFNTIAASVAHIYIRAGNPKAALEWLKQAHHAAVGMPGVATELQAIWPTVVLAGLESDADYAKGLTTWLNAALTPATAGGDNRVLKEKAGSILLLLDAAGYAVPDEDWGRVIAAPSAERHSVPPAMLLDRLTAASVGNRRGETVLFALLLSGGNVEDPSFLATLCIVRALRLVGLSAESAALAREAATLILVPAPAKP